jgi:uncharacterized membrane protein YhaH (DUF805 family)
MPRQNRSPATQKAFISFQKWRFICVAELFALLIFTGIARPTTARGGHHKWAIWVDLIFAVAIVLPSLVLAFQKYRDYAHALRSERLN